MAKGTKSLTKIVCISIFFLILEHLQWKAAEKEGIKKLFTDIEQFFFKKELFGKEHYQRLQLIRANWLQLFQLSVHETFVENE